MTGANSEKVTGGRTQFHHESRRHLCFSQSFITVDGIKTKYSILVGEYYEKRSLGRPSRRWMYNIEVDLKEGECVDEFRIAPLARFCEHGNELSAL
jgi:hypothetical protein